MFNYFNKTETASTVNNLKVKVQVEVEIEEKIGKLITGGVMDFHFNTDKKTAITASISPLKSPEIVSELYKVISQVVVEEFKIDRAALNDTEKIVVESKPFKLEILIFNVIVRPETILSKIIERLSETTIEAYSGNEEKMNNPHLASYLETFNQDFEGEVEAWRDEQFEEIKTKKSKMAKNLTIIGVIIFLFGIGSIMLR